MRTGRAAPPGTPRAVVVGLDHLNGVQAARILARAGVPVVGVARDPAHYGCRTNACEEVVLVRGDGDDALVTTLAEVGGRLGARALLLPCTDPYVRVLSRHRDGLAPWFELPLPPASVVDLLMDKAVFDAHATARGLRVPRSVVVREPADLDRALEQLTFPCVVKPPLSAAPRWERASALKAYRLASPDELRAAHPRLAPLADALLVQEWVPGPASALYSVNATFGRDGRPLATFVARKLRQWPVDTGESCLGEECRNDAVLDLALRLFGGLDHPYRGLAYLEVKQHAVTGEHVVIEPNVGRPTGRSAIAEAGGVPLLETTYRDALGLPLPPEREQRYGTVRWVHLRRDLQASVVLWRRGDLTVREWAASLRGPRTHALLSWSDPGPFVGDLARAARLGLSTRERRSRDYEAARAAVVAGR